MRFNLRSAHWFVAAVCLCQALALGVLGHSQAAPGAGQEFQPAPSDMRLLRLDPAFLEYLGQEDDRIQKALQAGNAQAAVRTDYAADIGFGKADEQIMLAILLSGIPQGKGGGCAARGSCE